MKGKNPRIILLGNNSGNNLGDAAIMSAILDSVSKILPDAEFTVPSIKPEFINKHYSELYKVKGIDVMPWTGSVRLFGIPTIYQMARSDVALICDGIIFGKSIFNPLFNFLITLIFLVPFAKLFNCKLVCFCCGIGPFPNNISELIARWVMNSCDLVTLRERDSVVLAQKIGVKKEIIEVGDIALVNPVNSYERADVILKENGLDPDAKYLGVNITRYIDGWLFDPEEKVENKDILITSIADAILNARGQLDNEFIPLVFSTQPMDDKISQKLADMLNTKVIGNSRYISHDIQAVMKKCTLFTGMRLHSLYLASSMSCPIVAMIYAPKVRSYMLQLKTPELGIELKDITRETYRQLIMNSWQNAIEIKAKQQEIVKHLKEKALGASQMLKSRYFSA